MGRPSHFWAIRQTTSWGTRKVQTTSRETRPVFGMAAGCQSDGHLGTIKNISRTEEELQIVVIDIIIIINAYKNI